MGARKAECTHNVIKKYVRFITSSFFTLCRNTTVISGTFSRAAKTKILNDETFPAAEASMGKNSRCSCSTKSMFLKIVQKFIEKHLC